MQVIDELDSAMEFSLNSVDKLKSDSMIWYVCMYICIHFHLCVCMYVQVLDELDSAMELFLNAVDKKKSEDHSWWNMHV